MKKNKGILTFTFVLIFGFNSVLAQTINSSISFNEFIERVKTEHPLAKKANNLVDIGKYQAASAGGLFDPQLNANIDNKYFSSQNYYTQANAEVKQGLYSGQSIKAGYEYGYGPQINPEAKTSLSGLPYLGVEFSLLQGLIIDKRRYEVLKGKQYQKIFEAESKIELNDLLLLSSDFYLTWLKDFTITDVNKRFLETANQRLAALVILSEVGERPAIDTIEAAILNQSREIEYFNSKVQLNKSFFQFLSFVWANDSNNANQAFVPKQAINELAALCFSKLVFTESFSSSQNPYLSLYSNKSNLLRLERKYKAELIKPKLDLKYNFLANNNPDFNNETSNSYFLNNYKWGAGFSMPLFLRTSVNDLKIAKLNLKNNNYEFANKSVELENKITALKGNMSLLASQIELAQKSLNYSRLLMEAEKIKFENNESSLFLLNTRESKVLESEIKLIETQFKFISSYFYLVYLKGDLVYQL
jgi:outer membrane protein TolC